MVKQEQIIEDIVDMFFAQKALYQKMTGEYVDKRIIRGEKNEYSGN